MSPIRLKLCLLCIIAAGCAERRPSSALATAGMKIGSQTFTLEIANTEASRRTGLMQRDTLPPDRGMIFTFGQERILQFHMLNTRIPLDILFLDQRGQIVSTHRMKPYDTRTLTESARPAKYAIELNAGAVARTGVKVGDVLQIPASARQAAD